MHLGSQQSLLSSQELAENNLTIISNTLLRGRQSGISLSYWQRAYKSKGQTRNYSLRGKITEPNSTSRRNQRTSGNETRVTLGRS